MPHTTTIEAAFRDPLMQQILGTAIERVPEIKHEGLMCTALAAILHSTSSSARREVKQTNTRRGRRVDISFDADGMPLEAKYHLDFDLSSVAAAAAHYSQVKAEVQRRGRYGSWNSGEAVVYELCRVKQSYFLWSVCSRGSNPVAGSCMELQSRRWLAQLPGSHQNNLHTYVQAEINRLSVSLADQEGLAATFLRPIRQGHSVVFSTLFSRQ